MGFLDDSRKQGGLGVYGNFLRRKPVNSAAHEQGNGHRQLAKELFIPQLIAIGVGSTIGAGVYVLMGTVAREHSGPALTISFLVAAVAAALSAFCYAELASRCPSAGSAYHYSYICVGEGIAWLIGWALILEYTVGGAAVARGISPNLAILFGGEGSLPAILTRQHVPVLGIVMDPCALILVFAATGLLCVGIKESSLAQAIVTSATVCAMVFVIIAGAYLGFTAGWPGYNLSSGYFPFGVDGMLAGSAIVFFSYIGFDSVASTAEEVKNPQRDLPLGIGLSLSICCILYMMVSIVIVGLVPYYALNPDTPISSAFDGHDMQWVVYIITCGTIMALCSTLLGSLLPQPRILMAMARDGLLPSFFSDVNKKTQIPVKSTLVTGAGAASLAFLMDVSQLAGMVSVGTLLAFTMVAVSVLILRYVPPEEVPFPSVFQETVHNQLINGETEACSSASIDCSLAFLQNDDNIKPDASCNFVSDAVREESKRKTAGWIIAFVCAGAIVFTYAACDKGLPWLVRYASCGVGSTLLLVGLMVLTRIDAKHNFIHSGGFMCPFVPLLPVSCIVINIYLLVNLGTATWARVSLWLAIGVLIYVFYGRHGSRLGAVYAAATQGSETHHGLEDSSWLGWIPISGCPSTRHYLLCT